MNYEDVLRYYSKQFIKAEIADYSRNRWIAIHTMRGGKKGLFLRYWRKDKKPLSLASINDFEKIMKEYKGLIPRTFYASINLFQNLNTKENVEDPNNIVSTTMVWDIDGSLKFWEKIVDIARVILDVLERENVTKSVYLIWSGRGIHVHIHELAISDDLRNKYNPLDLAYSVVEYVLRKSKSKILKIIKGAYDPERPLKLENEMDLKRVFTVPLSLHKIVDYAAVCFKPDEIDDFHLEWAKLESIKHNKNWRIYESGEADELALKAIKEIGGYFNRTGEIRTVIGGESIADKTTIPIKKISSAPLKKIGRFQVMALLQAARYFLLKGDLDKAKSFGLNRAIFYAWAKHHKALSARKPGVVKRDETKPKKFEHVGNEPAPLSENGWFIMGGIEQKPEDFDKEVVEKINSILPFGQAWEATLEFLKKFPKKMLMDQQKFFNKIYNQVKDDFLDKILRENKKEKTLTDFLKD